MRQLYTFLFYLLTPFILLKLIWRSRRSPAYRRRLGERFGFFPERQDVRPALWVHAVSVGETLAAVPLIRALMARYPDYQLVVTTMTPTGSDRVAAEFGDDVFHVYAPYDLPGAINRFMDRIRPALLIVMETELWPNMIDRCSHRQVPVVLANARLSQKSARGYQRFQGFSQAMLHQLSMVAAQHQDDAERFMQVGVRPSACQVTGNIKFDIDVLSDLRQRALALRQSWQKDIDRPIWVVVSTHAGEDEKILAALQSVLTTHPQLLLVLVPRHPERFDDVLSLCQQQFSVVRRSSGLPVDQHTQVLLGDTMGEVMLFLGACDMAFIGGSWVENGGHNMIEPAAWGKPIFAGPSLFNFAEVSRLLQQAGALAIVQTPEELAEGVCRLLDEPAVAEKMGMAALHVAEANRGALDRLLGIIDQQLAGRTGSS